MFYKDDYHCAEWKPKKSENVESEIVKGSPQSLFAASRCHTLEPKLL